MPRKCGMQRCATSGYRRRLYSGNLANTLNSIVWNQDEELMQWLVDARLDGFSVIRRTTDESVVEIGARAVANMQRFLASYTSVGGPSAWDINQSNVLRALLAFNFDKALK